MRRSATRLSPGLTLKLSTEGRIVGSIVGGKRLDRNVLGQTLLKGCRPRTMSGRRPSRAAGWSSRIFAADNPAHQCRVVERFMPTRDSVRWEVEIRGEAPVEHGNPHATDVSGHPANPILDRLVRPEQANRL